MADFPAMPLWTDAFIADTTHLTAAETGAYMMLLICAWRRPNCDLPDDDKLLARWARVSPNNWPRMKKIVMEFWKLDNGTWTQKRLSEVRETVSLKSALASKAGKASALKRQQTPSTNVNIPLQQPKPKPKPKPKDKKEERAKALLSKPNGFNALEFVKTWNDICGESGLPRVVKIDGQRRRKAEKRWREDFGASMSEWGDFCRRIVASDLLCGRKSDWTATFDWVLEPKNLTKTLEGNYDNKRHATASERIASEFGLAID